jgi:Zn finger protein HypA/HybF involved in hydrogenase expression
MSGWGRLPELKCYVCGLPIPLTREASEHVVCPSCGTSNFHLGESSPRADVALTIALVVVGAGLLALILRACSFV